MVHGTTLRSDVVEPDTSAKPVILTTDEQRGADTQRQDYVPILVEPAARKLLEISQ